MDSTAGCPGCAARTEARTRARPPRKRRGSARGRSAGGSPGITADAGEDPSRIQYTCFISNPPRRPGGGEDGGDADGGEDQAGAHQHPVDVDEQAAVDGHARTGPAARAAAREQRVGPARAPRDRDVHGHPEETGEDLARHGGRRLPPAVPCSTSTAMAMVGFSAGAKQMNQPWGWTWWAFLSASKRAWVTTWAEPVLPPTAMPARPARRPVPSATTRPSPAARPPRPTGGSPGPPGAGGHGHARHRLDEVGLHEAAAVGHHRRQPAICSGVASTPPWPMEMETVSLGYHLSL